jgi:hypothetical protein
MTLTATEKIWRIGVGMKKLVFCSDYNAPKSFSLVFAASPQARSIKE